MYFNQSISCVRRAIDPHEFRNRSNAPSLERSKHTTTTVCHYVLIGIYTYISSVLNSKYTLTIIPGICLQTDLYARVLTAHAFAYHYRRCRRYYIIMIVITTRT